MLTLNTLTPTNQPKLRRKAFMKWTLRSDTRNKPRARRKVFIFLPSHVVY
jgi:hypothetical protein